MDGNLTRNIKDFLPYVGESTDFESILLLFMIAFVISLIVWTWSTSGNLSEL